MLVQVYIPDSLTATEADYVIIGMSVPENQDLTSASFRSDLGNKLETLYQEAKGKANSRRKRRSGSTSVTVSKEFLLANHEMMALRLNIGFFVQSYGIESFIEKEEHCKF